MGHANFDAVRASGMNFNNKREFCEECQFGKSKILPFATKKEKTDKILERIHVDLCGPMETPGLDGERYFMAMAISGLYPL